MTTGLAERDAAAVRRDGLTWTRVLYSEWIKLRTLRSTFITLAVAELALAGLGPLFSVVTAGRWGQMAPADRAAIDPTALSLIGYYLAQLAVGVLGVLMITGEYATGMIRASFSAVPRRLPVLWAKAAVFGAVILVLSAAGSLAAFALGQAAMASTGASASLGDPGVARSVLGTALYLTVVGLLSLGLGSLIRSTAGGVAAVFGLLLVLPEVVLFLPLTWSRHIGPYLPSNAGHALSVVRPDPSGLAPWTGFGVFTLYALAALACAAVLLRRRDA